MGKGELPSKTRRRRFDFWIDACRLGRRVHEVENGPSGGLISLHVQAPCIIVACACLHVHVDLVNGPDGATTLD